MIALRPEIAVLTVKVASQLGIAIPGELQVVGLHHSPMFTMTHPEITSVSLISPERLGQKAARLLAESLARYPRIAPREVIESILIERGSTRPSGR